MHGKIYYDKINLPWSVYAEIVRYQSVEFIRSCYEFGPIIIAIFYKSQKVRKRRISLLNLLLGDFSQWHFIHIDLVL